MNEGKTTMMEEIDVILQDYLLNATDGITTINEEESSWSRKKMISTLKEDAVTIKAGDPILGAEYENVISYLGKITDEDYETEKKIILSLCKN